MLFKLSLERPECWYKHAGKIQQVINNTEPRITKDKLCKLLTGLDMRISRDVQLKSFIQGCLISELDDERGKLRKEARENNQSIQEENKKLSDTRYSANGSKGKWGYSSSKDQIPATQLKGPKIEICKQQREIVMSQLP